MCVLMMIVRSIRYTAENRFIRFRFVECFIDSDHAFDSLYSGKSIHSV